MFRQENYSQSEFYNEGDNLLSSLLEPSSDQKQNLQFVESTNLKDIEFIPEESDEEQLLNVTYKDILEKQESNCALPQNFYQEHPQDSILIVTQSAKKTLSESGMTARKDTRNDKLAFLEQTRVIKIQRYLRKKRTRIWGKKISYDCRKLVADKRQRVNGRFVKKSFDLKGEQKKNIEFTIKRQQKKDEDKQQNVFKVDQLFGFILN